jgi:hypothetical protein
MLDGLGRKAMSTYRILTTAVRQVAEEYLAGAPIDALGAPLKTRALPMRRQTGHRNDGVDGPLRHLSAKLLVARISSDGEPSMGELTTIGLDLAKHVFQVHGSMQRGRRFCASRFGVRRVLAFFSQLPRCVVGMEACATAH